MTAKTTKTLYRAKSQSAKGVKALAIVVLRCEHNLKLKGVQMVDRQYQILISKILSKGVQKEDRTNVGTISLFGETISCDLQDGFPLLTSKRLSFHNIKHELIWFLRGDTDISYLKENNVSIWNAWAKDDYVGKIYGYQWAKQLPNIINQIKSNPDSRRLLVNAWQIEDLQDMALPPCHYAFQFSVTNGKLSTLVSMRSSDVFLGLPYNIASYALLTHIVAKVCKLDVGVLTLNLGDTHIYLNHKKQCNEILRRVPLALPSLELSGEFSDLSDITGKQIQVSNYNPHTELKGEIAV